MAIASAAGAIEHQHAPRRVELLLLLAYAWHDLGNDDAALPVVRQACRTAQSFQLNTWGLPAWSLLAHLAQDPAEAERARQSGAAIARALIATLPPDRAQSFRRLPAVVRLLGTPLL